MSVLKTDAFTGVDADPIGGIWTTGSGWQPWKRLSNNAEPSTPTVDCAAYENTVSWPNDQYSKAIIQTVPTHTSAGDGVGVGVRFATGSSTCYCVVTGNAGAGTDLQKRNSGYTQLAHVSTNFVSTDEIYIEAQSNAIVAKKNGSTFSLSATDSAIASGKTGLFHSGEGSASAILDSWEGGDFTSSSSVVPILIPQYARRKL